MVGLILKKNRTNDSGYLLLESLVALSVLSLLILVLYPIVADWLMLVEAEKAQVELYRALYETAQEWPNPTIDSGYEVKRSSFFNSIRSKKHSGCVYI